MNDGYIIELDPVRAAYLEQLLNWDINTSLIYNVQYFVSVRDTDESIQGTTKSKKNYA